MKKFSHKFEISYQQVDKNQKLKINELINLIQEIAIIHATQLGLDYTMQDIPYYWVIMRTKVVMEEYPKLKESIRIESCIEGLDKIYSVRRFNIYNEEEVCIGYVQGYYLLMDRVTQKPINMKNAEDDIAIYNYPYQGEKIEKLNVKNLNLIKSELRKVYSSEIDGNNHMNNAHYVRWVLDMFSTEELLNAPMKKLQIQYMQEMLEADEIVMELSKNDLGEIYIVGKNKESKGIHFLSKVLHL